MKLTRRQFMAGATATAGVAAFVACGIPEHELIVQSPAELPEDLVRGDDTWYATTWPDDRGGDGLLVRVMQGRAKKIAGNPDFPTNRGKLGHHDTALQLLYHPDRIPQPLLRRSKGGTLARVSWSEAERRFLSALEQGQGNLAVVTNPLRGHLGWISSEFANAFRGRHLPFDPVEQGVLHAAIKHAFGQDRLPDFDIGRSHTVLSFGADWLTSWVSPTSLAVKYGQFRGADGHGYLIHAESRFSATSAAADRWLPVRPGWEGRVALAIGRLIADEGLVPAANIDAWRAALPKGGFEAGAPGAIAGPGNSGIAEDRLREVARKFAEGKPSLAFGGGSAGAHTSGVASLTAIYALNYLTGAVGTEGGIRFNPPSPIQGVPDTAHGASFDAWERELAEWRAGNVKTVIIRGANLVHGLPRSTDPAGALRNVPNVISFSTVLDDTAAQADLVLPEKTFLEAWGMNIPEPAPGYQVVSFQQPVAAPAVSSDGTELLSDARSFGDMLLWAAGGALGSSTMLELARKGADTLFELNKPSDSINAPTKALFWTGVLQRGGWWDTTSVVENSPTLSAATGPVEPEMSGDPGGPGEVFSLVPFESHSLINSQIAATPWAQQTPDPVTTAAWSTWAEISTTDASRLGIQEGDRLLLRSTVGEIQALAYVSPAAQPGTVSIPIGNGLAESGRWTTNVGANVLSILVDKKDSETGALAWAATRVRVLRQGTRVKLPKLEGNATQYPVEPGVPILVVAPGQSAEEAEHEAHEETKRHRTDSVH